MSECSRRSRSSPSWRCGQRAFRSPPPDWLSHPHLTFATIRALIAGTTLVGTALELGFAGIAAPSFTAQRTNNDYLLGIVYVLLAATGITVSNVALKRLASAVDTLMAAGTQLLIGTIPLSLIAALTESPSDVNWTPNSYSSCSPSLCLARPSCTGYGFLGILLVNRSNKTGPATIARPALESTLDATRP